MSLTSLFRRAKLAILALPLSLYFGGAALNQSVVVANGGTFPVMLNEVDKARMVLPNGYLREDDSAGRHCLMTNATRLNWLADYIRLDLRVVSIGDLMIELGDFISSYAFVVWATIMILQLWQGEGREQRLGPFGW